MGIIGNKTLLHKLPLTQVGGTFATDIATLPNWQVLGIGYTPLSAVPNGYYVGGAWVLPQIAGSISAVNGLVGNHLFSTSNLAGGINVQSSLVGSGDISTAQIRGLSFLISTLNQTSTLNSNIAGSVNVSASLAGSGNLNGALGALVGIVASLNGSGNITANIAGALQAIANLSGSGDIVGAIKATVGLIASLNGTSNLTSAIIGNWDMVCSLSGQNTLTASTIAKAFLNANLISSNGLTINNGAVVGSLTANITSSSILSPENLATSVWSSLASQYNVTGTMGAKLNGIGSVGNPWDEIIDGTYTARDIMVLLLEIATQEGGVSSLTLQQIEASLILAKENTVIGLY